MNLTREEARERARLLTVAEYDVELDLTRGETTFGSTTTVRFGCAEPGASTFLELVGASVQEIVLNGRPLDPAQVAEEARITLTDLAADNEVRVVAEVKYMNTGEGLHRFVDPVDDEVYLYTQFEVNDARRMFACFDQPDLKGRFAFTVTAPAHWQVVSVSPTPEPERDAAGRATYRFARTPVLSTYVTALVAGPYHHVHDEVQTKGGGVPLGLYCRASLAEHLDAEHLFTLTKAGFAWFEEKFGRVYPFAKYDQLFVPEFNAGAMENAGCVTILEDYVFRSRVTDAAYERRGVTVLHELAHMWFGDLVTMRWWDDLWLNESFAEFVSTQCQSEVTQWPKAWTTFANVEKAWAYRQDQLPSTHPIAADIADIEDVELNFDGITYAKGASVLKLLVYWVGPEAFFEGARHYFERHAWGNTELADLLHALEETSGRDLDVWAKEWLQTAGVNTLRAEYELDGGADDAAFTSFAVLQEAPQAWPTLRSHRLVIGLYRLDAGKLVRTERVELDVAGPRTEVPELVGVRRPDLVLLNDDDLTYAKIRLDPYSLATATHAIGTFADSLPRALCWAAAWDMTRDAEMSATDFLTLVLEGISGETDISVVQVLLQQGSTAIEFYTVPEKIDAARLQFATGLAALAGGAAAASDHQLAFARAFASNAASPEQLAVVRSWLDGTEQLPGLAVDADLRWHLLQALVAAGLAEDAEIDAELARDDTASGRRQAAATRAMRPSIEAKEQAWADVVERDELPNALLAATIGGFAVGRQRELLRPFVDRYFEAVPKVYAERTNETAQNIIMGLYPALLVEPETVMRTQDWLAQNEVSPGVQRMMSENLDTVQRALRARARDAQG